jgi:hypothetical protein
MLTHRFVEQYCMPLGLVALKYGPFIRRQLETLFANKTRRDTYYDLLLTSIEKRSLELAAVVLPPALPVHGVGTAENALATPTLEMTETTTETRREVLQVASNDGLDMFGILDDPGSEFKIESTPAGSSDLRPVMSVAQFDPRLPTGMPVFPQTLPISENQQSLLSAAWNDADLLIDPMALLPFPDGLCSFTEASTPSTNTIASLSSSTNPSSASPPDITVSPDAQSVSSRRPRDAVEATPPQSRSSKRRRVAPPTGAAQRGPRCRFPGCDYVPIGAPKWWKGSMDKHIKNQHSNSSKIYRCDYPGCKSEFKNRQDNLKAHKKEKGHWTERDGRGPEKDGGVQEDDG